MQIVTQVVDCRRLDALAKQIVLAIIIVIKMFAKVCYQSISNVNTD